MKFKLKYLLIIIIGILINISCTQNETDNNKTEKSTADKDNITLNNELDSNFIYAMWVSKNKGRWIEFFDDGTFNSGMDGKDDVKGKKYELNLKKSTIAIEIRETTKIFKYRRDGKHLYFKGEGNDKELKYTRKD